jgi:hypothetical protein
MDSPAKNVWQVKARLMEVRNALSISSRRRLLAPLRRSYAGAYMPIMRRRHYADHLVAPLRRSRIGAITAVSDSQLCFLEIAHGTEGGAQTPLGLALYAMLLLPVVCSGLLGALLRRIYERHFIKS